MELNLDMKAYEEQLIKENPGVLEAEWYQNVLKEIPVATGTILRLQEITTSSPYIINLTFDELKQMPFESAKAAIDKFPLEKRLDILEQLTTYKAHIYEEFSRYNTGIPKEIQMSPKEFKILMGKVKHLEILQGWLYAIE